MSVLEKEKWETIDLLGKDNFDLDFIYTIRLKDYRILAVDAHTSHIRFSIGGSAIYISSNNRIKTSEGHDVL